MTTRSELMDVIIKLRDDAANEAAQVKSAVGTLTDVVASLKSQIAGLELSAGVAADFSAESAKLEEVRQSIDAIYETPTETPPVVEPVPTTLEVTPVVEPSPVAPVEIPVVAPVVS